MIDEKIDRAREIIAKSLDLTTELKTCADRTRWEQGMIQVALYSTTLMQLLREIINEWENEHGDTR